MGAGQQLDDLYRDLCTRVDGALALMQNIVIRIRQPTPRLPQYDFKGKVCIVTGGNAGVGQATAEAMVARGARVIIACRDEKRAKAAARALDATPTHAGCQTHPVETGSLDLASLDSVRSFASGFNKRGLPLGLLICNAGIMAPPQRLVTKDGLEQQFQALLLQVNYLGHWLLTHELLKGQHQRRSSNNARHNKQNTASSSLTHHQSATEHNSTQQHGKDSSTLSCLQGKRSNTAIQDGTRVVMLSSLTYKAGRVRFDDLDARRSYSGFHRYSDSKLAEVLAVREFAQRMDRNEDSNVKDTICAVHPGLLQTQLAKGWLQNGCPRVLRPVGIPFINFIFPLTFLPAQYGVQSVLYAATAPADQVHGKYIAHSKVVQTARHARDDSIARGLWDVSCQLTNISPHAM